VYLENAGGSQVPGCVSVAIRDYMQKSYVQVGAGYPASQKATAVVAEAHAFMEEWVNAGDRGKVVLGPSTTALIHIVANAYGEILQPGDEIIVADTNHEANAWPWYRLERFGIKVKCWSIDPSCFQCNLADLEGLITERTKLVTFPHVSNLLGEIVDVKAITDLVHSRGAKVFVDGVAYAPHGVIDVQAWGVDWYVFSNYKVYGPHMATLYGSHEAFSELTGPNHHFIPKDAIPSKWELGALNHEGCAGIVGLKPYIGFLAGKDQVDRQAIVRACEAMTELERPLVGKLLNYLESKEGVKVIGPGSKGKAVGTISFLSEKAPSNKIAEHLATREIGIRSGHMYAMRICHGLSIPPETGVVRISLLHYNTMEEIERTIQALDEVL
jgi:cysteine desulfurase family protein (TIGR01976 family)